MDTDTSGRSSQGCGQKWKDGGGGPKQQEGQQGQGDRPAETRVYVVEGFTKAGEAFQRGYRQQSGGNRVPSKDGSS